MAARQPQQPRPGNKTTPSGAPEPEKQGKPVSHSKKVAAPEAGQFHTLKWDRLARHAPWVAGQSNQLNPGDPRAISRLRHQPKYKARTKKVIRPRVRKQNSEQQGDNNFTS